MKEGILYINDNVFSILVASSYKEQETGLMHQPWPPPNMAFHYKISQINKFWMKSTPSPLDILFCNNGRVSQICHGEPYSLKVIGANEPSDLVIEFPLGTVSEMGIAVGDFVALTF